MRWPLSIALCFSVPIAWYIRTAVYSFHGRMGEVWLSACLTVLLVQVIAWPFRIWLGLRIRKSSTPNERVSRLSSQFGIQHLMLVTTVVAVIVGGGRLAFPYVQSYLTTTRELIIFAFLIVVACVLCIPLAFSILALRRTFFPTLCVIAFAAVATFVEVPLAMKITGATGGPDWLHLSLINLFTLIPVFAASLALRLLNYRLARLAKVPADLASLELDQDFQ